MAFKILELTKDNEQSYLGQVASLENKVLADMESHGQVGQLFTTGEEDISKYAHSQENSVLMAVNDQNKVIAATYIVQGNTPFTYNDITKYFKYGEEYQKYVKSQYPSENEYRKAMLDTYQEKISAFKFAEDNILEQFPQYQGDIIAFLNHEMQEENNHFHEKSQLRELLNVYMSQYMQKLEQQKPGTLERYNQFYWTTAQDIAEEFQREAKPNSDDAVKYEQAFEMMREDFEYSEILQRGPLVIHEQPNFDTNQYYSINTDNAVELDTYLTDPDDRENGIAKILLLNGISKHMENHFSDPTQNEIFLCVTLHRDNLSSKYVSEFFGLKDSLYVQRRDGRNREVHVCRIRREEYKQYLDKMKKKIAVLYGYNPDRIAISSQEKKSILEEQLQYERTEMSRLTLNHKNGKDYRGCIDYKKSKAGKIARLQQQIDGLPKTLKPQTGNHDDPSDDTDR